MPRHRDRGRLHLRRGLVHWRVERRDQIIIVFIGERRAHGHRFGQFADPVHQAQYRAHRGRISATLTCTNIRQHIFGSVAEPFEPGEVEEAAAALDRVEETEDRIEPVAVGRVGFPRHDLPSQRFKRFLGFRYEFLQ